MFGKKKKLMYYFENDKFNNKEFSEEMISRFLTPADAKSSCWWSSLKPTLFGLDMRDTVIEFHNKFMLGKTSGNSDLEYSSVSTARKCPSLINMFTNSYLLRSPSDMTITIDKFGAFISHSANPLIEVMNHPTSQFYTETDNLFEGKMNLKFIFPFNLKSDVQWLFLQPMYHNNMWFTVANGAIFNGLKYLFLNSVFTSLLRLETFFILSTGIYFL